MACGKFRPVSVPKNYRTFRHYLYKPLLWAKGVEESTLVPPLDESDICFSRYPQTYCSCGPDGPMFYLEWDVEE